MKGTLLTFIIHCGFRSTQGIACKTSMIHCDGSCGYYYCEWEQPQIYQFKYV